MADDGDAQVGIVETMGVFAKHTESGFIQRIGGASALVTGLDHAAFNHVSVTGKATTADMGNAAVAVAEAGFPWSVMLRDEIDDVHLEWVRSLGLEDDEETVPLMMATAPVPAPWPSELEAVRGAWTLSMHRALVCDAFELPKAMVDPLITDSLAEDPAVEVVVGILDGLPVTTAMSVRVGEAVGVFSVGTSDAARGRGYGAAATWAAMEPPLTSGAAFAVLQTSPLGHGVYERLGFDVVAIHRRWVAPGS